jgi:mRNA interferase RelE/StbE
VSSRSRKPGSSRKPLAIARTDSFARDFKNLPREVQQRAEKAITLLATNPAHPSLRTKKMKGLDIWEASVTLSYRITYERAGELLILRRIGTHDILRRESD